jgi:hypothetical protein
MPYAMGEDDGVTVVEASALQAVVMAQMLRQETGVLAGNDERWM